MQKAAAYLLERRAGMDSAEARAAEAATLRAQVAKWLGAKGGNADLPSGTYAPEDGSSGYHRIVEAVDGLRSWWMLTLTEDTTEGRRFAVSISVTTGTDRVSVYVTLEAGWTKTQIMPVDVDPRCPRIVRDLLALPGPWYHGASLLHDKKALSGFEQGEWLAAEIAQGSRTVPVLVVSTEHGYCALPNLDVTLGYDLCALANLYVVDEGASWALRENLGPQWSCYRGAVRLYWPQFSSSDDRYLHPLWTAERLVSGTRDAASTRDVFRKQLRSLLFRTSALSVIRPTEIDSIRDAVSKNALSELRDRAHSVDEYREFAELYAAENQELREERDRLRARVDDLSASTARLESDRQALLGHLRAAKAKSDGEGDELAPDAGQDGDGLTPPAAGDVRFYKKTYSKPGYDVLVPVKDCEHNAWQGAHAADKARKGIARLEGRDDWQTLQHCGSCSGGGMWRVRW